MATKIFVNLPVQGLKKSIEFFTKSGYTFNPDFTDENTTCMIISDTIYVLLLTHARFKKFTKKEIADSKKTTEVLLALEVASKEKVDEQVKKAKEAGGAMYVGPQHHSWMDAHSFADPDGHQWSYFMLMQALAHKVKR